MQGGATTALRCSRWLLSTVFFELLRRCRHQGWRGITLCIRLQMDETPTLSRRASPAQQPALPLPNAALEEPDGQLVPQVVKPYTTPGHCQARSCINKLYQTDVSFLCSMADANDKQITLELALPTRLRSADRSTGETTRAIVADVFEDIEGLQEVKCVRANCA